MSERFKIYTGLLKAYENGTEKRFRTTASSTISDLVGDEILPPAIEKMAEKAKGNLTIFLNHEYRVPEDVLGSVDGTSMATRGVDGEGNPIVDLDFDIKVNEANPRALQTFEAIKSGVKLGTSIGAIVKHATKKKGGGLRIDDLELLEASIVGIPANPRSWVQYAAKSLRGSEIVLDDESVVEDESVLETLSKGAEEMLTGTAEPEIALAACPTCTKSSDECDCEDCSCKKDVTPEVTAAEPDKEAGRTRVTVTVDSDAAQDAPKATPEPAVLDEDRADVMSDPPTLGDTVTRAFDTSALDTLVKQLQAVVQENSELRKQFEAKSREADEANENLAVARQIIDRIADLPVGRKTAFKAAVEDYRTKFPQYDDEYLKFLEK